MIWPVFAVLIGCGVSVFLLCLAYTAIAKYKVDSPEREVARALKKDPSLKKSVAFKVGYKDMADAYAKVFHSRYINASYSKDVYDNIRVEDDCLRRCVQEEMIYSGKNKYPEFDPALGQTNEKYLGSEDASEFKDYYLGGMHFLVHLDEMRERVVREKADRLNRKKLMDARKAGLKEMNDKVIDDLRQLSEIRSQTLSTESIMQNWDRQMKEISND